jgi:ethanolamine utilization protein EutN
MRLGRVLGRVWASVKVDQFEGVKLLLVQPITAEGTDTGQPLVAVDAVGAGAGETIYWCRGREASLALLPAEVGADAAVVGIVDSVEVTHEE